jgi:hypothetical protein
VAGAHRAKRPGCVGRGDVGDQRPDLGAGLLAEPRRGLLQRLGVPAGNDDAVVGGQPRGDREADAGRAAADQGGPCADGDLPGTCAPYGLVLGAVLGLA